MGVDGPYGLLLYYNRFLSFFLLLYDNSIGKVEIYLYQLIDTVFFLISCRSFRISSRLDIYSMARSLLRCCCYCCCCRRRGQIHGSNRTISGCKKPTSRIDFCRVNDRDPRAQYRTTRPKNCHIETTRDSGIVIEVDTTCNFRCPRGTDPSCCTQHLTRRAGAHGIPTRPTSRILCKSRPCALNGLEEGILLRGLIDGWI